MLFKDRIDAAHQLAKKLVAYQDQENVIVVGIAKGGIPLAKEIAQVLRLPYSWLWVRKISYPPHEHVAIGAVSETEIAMVNESLVEVLQVPQGYFEEQLTQIKTQMSTIKRSEMDCKGKTVLLIDDGIATGITMKVAIASIMGLGADKVHVATPVISTNALKFFQKHLEDLTYLACPLHFQRLAEFYNSFSLVEEIDSFSK